ncbi:MAG: citrate synthase [Chthonomonadales bacterium]|nr:citrate synthase [Chthonomonadales bacterium]
MTREAKTETQERTESAPARANGSRIQGGLEEVVAGQSNICYIDGKHGRLLYYGYDVAELAAQSSFEEVAYLLWYGRLPGKIEFDAFLDSFTGNMDLPIETVMILRMFPKHATPMEVVRTAVSSLGHWDPDSGNTRLDACLRKAIRLTEHLPQLVAAHHRLREGLEPIRATPGRSIAFNFLQMLHGDPPDPTRVTAFDVALILHADHELNASTFAARVVAATMSDMYSAITAAVGALKGPLHGGANQQAVRMFEEIGTPESAERWVKDALARKVRIPGFGHRVYRTEDPRATILRNYAETVSRGAGDTRLYDIASEVERVVRESTSVFPNVDLYSGIVYHAMGIPSELFTPIFAISRMVGWTAHVLEQWSNNRLIRPRAEYTGPIGLDYVPINRR